MIDSSAGPAAAPQSSDEVADSDTEAETKAHIRAPPAPPAGPMPVGPCKNCFDAKTDCLGYYIQNGKSGKRSTWALSCVRCASTKKGCVKYVEEDLPLVRALRPGYATPSLIEDTNFALRPAAKCKMILWLHNSDMPAKSNSGAEIGPSPVASGSGPQASTSRLGSSVASGMSFDYLFILFSLPSRFWYFAQAHQGRRLRSKCQSR